MTTSQAANSAILRSIQRARDRQVQNGLSVPRTDHSRPPTRGPDNTTTTIETITTGPNGEQHIERRVVNTPNPNQTKPPWNRSTVAPPPRTPRSAFVDNYQQRPIEHNTRQVITVSPPTPPLPIPSETTPHVKVVRVPSTVVEQPSSIAPIYFQPQPTRTVQHGKMIRTDPDVIVLESQPAKRRWWNCFRRKKGYRTRPNGEREILLNQPEAPVYRFCQCCAKGRIASLCPSCYFFELFYGCPLYCWILTFLLLLLPMLALFGFFLSEQPAINPAKRQYLVQQSAIAQYDTYAVMHNCAKPYCTGASLAVTINQLYQTYHDYSATQITSNANISRTFSFILITLLHFVMYLNRMM